MLEDEITGSDSTHIAGRLTNGPLNLMAWIQSPRSIDPGTLMLQRRRQAARSGHITGPTASRGQRTQEREEGDHKPEHRRRHDKDCRCEVGQPPS